MKEKELTEKDLRKMESENEIVFDEDGNPMIVLDSPFPRNFKVHILDFRNPKDNSKLFELQRKNEIAFIDKVLKELEDMFKGF